MPQKLTKSSNFRIWVRNKKGHFARARTGSTQRIQIRDIKNGETFDLGVGKTELKKLKNIGKIIEKAITNIKDGIWNKLLGRKVEIKKQKQLVLTKKQTQDLQKGFKEKIERFRDKKEGLKTSIYSYDFKISLLAIRDFISNLSAKIILLLWEFKITFAKTKDVEFFTVSSGDIAEPFTANLLNRLEQIMNERLRFWQSFFGKSDVKIEFIKSILKVSK